MVLNDTQDGPHGRDVESSIPSETHYPKPPPAQKRLGRTDLLVLVDARGARERGDVDAGQRPAAREDADLLAKLFDLLVADLALRGRRRDADEVLEELAARLLLQDERGLDGAVQEVRDDLNVRLHHVARRDRRRAKTDAAGHLGGGVARDGVFCQEAVSTRVRRDIKATYC